MLEEVATIKKYKELMEIGSFFRRMRTLQGIEQEALATDARAIAHIEAGNRVANTTFEQVASALGHPIDFVENGLPAIATAMEEAACDNILVPVRLAASGYCLVYCLVGSLGFYTRIPESLNEEQRDAVSAFINAASDWNDILGDLSFQARNEAEASLTDPLKDGTDLGLAAYNCSADTKLSGFRTRMRTQST
jgi:transcriptional regulator with XRE-family HTH domain